MIAKRPENSQHQLCMREINFKFGEPAEMSRLFVGYKVEVKNKAKYIDCELIHIN